MTAASPAPQRTAHRQPAPGQHLLTLAGELRERGAGLVVLRHQIDTTVPAGRLVFHILGAIDELQRELIVEGLQAARARGRTRGRKHLRFSG